MHLAPGPALEAARGAIANANEKLRRLTAIDPYLIDLSLRENPFGSNVGQTLQNKLDILPKLRAFGFQNILLGTLDYAGRNAYRLTLDFFRQLGTRAMDLPPERIGGSYGYRVASLAADTTVLAGRLREIAVPGPYARQTLERMIGLMRQDLRDGVRLVYDEPDVLRELYRRAGGVQR
jgi:hypothetical protein